MREVLLEVGSRLYEGRLQRLSKFGALIATTTALQVGATVNLTTHSNTGEPVTMDATIVGHVDAAQGRRLGIVAGVVVRFTEESHAASSQLAREMTRSGRVARTARATPEYLKRETRPMKPIVLSSLQFASRRAGDDGEARLVMQGELEEFDCGTLLSIVERTKRSGRLRLLRLDATATIEIVEGEIIRVQSSWERAPRKILADVLSWKSGSFELRSMPAARLAAHHGLRITPLLIDDGAACEPSNGFDDTVRTRSAS